MFSIKEVLEEENQERAFDYLRTKRNGVGIDKIPLSQVKEFWNLNKERFTDDILYGIYTLGIVHEREITNAKGKRRKVASLNSIDRFVGRLLAQKMNDAFAEIFLDCSYAYQENKGIENAVQKAKEYILQKNEYVVDIDLKNYFDEISHERLFFFIEQYIKDMSVLKLIKDFVESFVLYDGESYQKVKGLIQGSPISPVLSNLYLHELDCMLEEKKMKWIRFSDNICIYVKDREQGMEIYKCVTSYIRDICQIPINEEKSGIYSVYERRLLGYDFIKRNNDVLIKKHNYQKKEYYRYWHPSALEFVNNEYHIIRDGILTKKDYSLLFENDEVKQLIPIEATEQINIYSDVTVMPSILNILNKENVRLTICNKYGDVIGYYLPESYTSDTKIILKQCSIYNDSMRRTTMARKLQIAALHNIRANLKYYNKKESIDLRNVIEYISQSIANINESCSINEMCLIEARCRQYYYESFNEILNNSDFIYEKRSRRPPKDRINALISFGNTVLYNKIQQIIWKSQLDSRIGIIHAANKRHYSLNLDFADLFKPIIVDRIIFALINRKQIGADDFITNADGSVYLNNFGKKLFLEAFDEKLNVKITSNNTICSYYRVIENEIKAYKRYLLHDEIYRPYKYR